MCGQPVGAALESLNQRYADLSSALSGALEDVRYGNRVIGPSRLDRLEADCHLVLEALRAGG